MRKDFGAQTWSYPMAVFILASYGEDGTPDAMNAGWGGVTGHNEISLCIAKGHKTAANILAKKGFTLAMADADHVVECDYVGLVSGNDEPKKLEKAGFHTTKASMVDAPIIEELPFCLECKLKSYEPETGLLVAEIVNANADEKILDADGKIDTEKMQPLVFDVFQGAYRKVGEKVGTAFSDGKKIQ